MAKIAVGFGAWHMIQAGIFAGLVFVAFQMCVAGIVFGPGAFLNPLNMIGAIVLGPEALNPGYPPGPASTVGFLVHMLLSIVYGTIFAALVPRLTTTGTLTTAGIVFGTVLWLVNFYAVAPLAGWTWFPERTNAAVQFVAHAFVYGCPLGWYLGAARSRTRIS